MSGSRTSIGCAAMVGLLWLQGLCSGQTLLLNSGGTGGAANSNPTASNYLAVYQQNSTDLTTLTTTAHSGTVTGEEAFITTGVSGSGIGDNNQPAVGFYSNPNSTGATVIYDTSTTFGSNTGNPLNLGTSSATPNTFSLPIGATMTYAADFGNNYHGSFFISLINPQAVDAGSATVTNPTSGGFLGVAMQATVNTGTATFQLGEQRDFATTHGFFALETGGTVTTTANHVRLVLSLTANSSTQDSVSGALYQIPGGIGTTPTLLGTLPATAINLGTSSGQFDLTAPLALEIGEPSNYNSGNSYYVGNISLSEVAPEPGTTAIVVLATAGGLLRRKRSARSDA